MRIVSLLLLTWCLVGSMWGEERQAPVIDQVKTQVYFSPHGGCTEAIVREIEQAKREILVQAYSFTSKPISKALVAASRRGVAVRAILDKSQRTEKYSGADFLAQSGIPVVIDERPAIAHSKVLVIDADTVITGSFNFTSSAEERNVENVLILRSPDLNTAYRGNWQERLSVSVPYIPHSER